MKSFITKLTALTLAIALIGWLVFSLFLPEYYLPVFPFLLGFFFVVTLAIHAYQLKIAKKDIGKFARSNMLITFFKLMTYSVLAVIYIALDRENAIQFVVGLMFLYLVYSFFEVKEVSKINRLTRK
ncbi:hypothetical protein D1614_02815 [Maribellus luteus]|uniref:Uncharacterized protein n=1 Tax=Maribellus luteus TaxID=2305463 RepID=A0A399SZU8_9BACT|nr:hypothetical protein [Maribellus luteus]RIJ49690.1 hypothetical protein D1614_02815 [Maribellus luteus]